MGLIIGIIYHKLLFMEEENQKTSGKAPDGFTLRLKNFLKKYPGLFLVLYYTLGIYVGKSAKKAIAHTPKGSVIINLGAGVKKVREDVIDVDIAPYTNVDVVADVTNLPFKDNYADAVIAESLLEHVRDPITAVKEMHRILKPDGLIYISTPFIIGFHSSPGDYQRWTVSGMRELLKDFQEKELGIAVGPTNAMTYILREWLALVLSFNSDLLRQILSLGFMVLFAPLNLLDFIFVHYKGAENIAHIFYFVGTKK